MTRLLKIGAQPFTSEAWAHFGWVPVADTDPSDGIHTLEFAWTDAHLNVISHAYDEVEHTSDGAIVRRMYRHDTHTQALMPLNCDAVLAAAPARVDFSNPSHLDTVHAFLLRPLDCLVLHRGTWHWGPFPVGREPVRLLNVQGRRYSEDNASVDLEDTGARMTVTVPSTA